MVRFKDPGTREWRPKDESYTTVRIGIQQRDALKQLSASEKLNMMTLLNMAVDDFVGKKTVLMKTVIEQEERRFRR